MEAMRPLSAGREIQHHYGRASASDNIKAKLPLCAGGLLCTTVTACGVSQTSCSFEAAARRRSCEPQLMGWGARQLTATGAAWFRPEVMWLKPARSFFLAPPPTPMTQRGSWGAKTGLQAGGSDAPPAQAGVGRVWFRRWCRTGCSSHKTTNQSEIH